jgi:zinc transporter
MSGIIHAYLLDGRGGGESLDWEGVERWTPAAGTLWLHLDYAAAETQAWLGLRSGIPPTIRDALVDRDPRPRVLVDDDALLLVVRGVNLNRGAQPEDMVSVRCWAQGPRIITLRHRPVGALDTIAARLDRGKGPRTSGELIARMIDAVLEPVVTVIDQLDDEVARAEDEVLTRQVPELRARLADLRRRAINLRRFIGPQRDAFNKLGGLGLSWFDDGVKAELREAADRQARTVEELDAARDRAAVTHEELQARMDELANRRLYILSLVTAVFLPMSFVTGLLGVNVGGVPAQHIDWAFWLLLGLLVTSALGLIWLFRRWRWL